jgi:hypothetical protein
MEMQEKPSKLVPALIGGAFIAVFSHMPVLNLGNCVCCMWVVAGGAIAARLYKRSLPAGGDMTSSDGAVSGFLAGAFGALFGAFLRYFLAVVGLDFSSQLLNDVLNNLEDVPRELQDSLEMLRASGGFSPLLVLLGLIGSLIVNSVFATAGGLLGAALQKKSAPPSGRRTR